TLGIAPVGPAISASLPDDEAVSWSGEVAWPGADHIALRLDNLVLADGDVLLLSDPAGARVETVTGPINQETYWTLPFPGDSVLIDVVGDGASAFAAVESRLIFNRPDRAEALKAGVESIYRQLRAPEEAPSLSKNFE